MFFCVCVCVCVCVAKDLANHHHIDIVFLFSKAFHREQLLSVAAAQLTAYKLVEGLAAVTWLLFLQESFTILN